MSAIYTTDEYGRPFIIVKEQEKKSRSTGLEAQKSFILAAKTLTKILKTSLGPRGLDKILISPDGDITITNDGATILSQLDLKHEICKLMVQLSKSQDEEIGDGTTSVVVLAGSLLEQAELLLNKGVHPTRIYRSMETACELCLAHLDKISETVEFTESKTDVLLKAALTSLSSKIVTKSHHKFASIAVEAIINVADFERKDVNFELIKVDSKIGGELEDTVLVKGVVLDKEMSHPQMPKTVKDAKIAILTCAFEPPKPKTKHKLEIEDENEYIELMKYEQNEFIEMIDLIKKSGANFAICQWGFDDEANHLLLQNGINAVRWVGGPEIEQIAIATKGQIVPRFKDLTPEKLGTANVIRETSIGTSRENKLIYMEGCANNKSITILVRGSNKMIVDEAKRSLHDALCAVRNLIVDNRIVYGGGSSELSLSIMLDETANHRSEIDQLVFRAYAQALEQIPYILAENSGLSVVETVSQIKSKQVNEDNCLLGIDCLDTGEIDMKKLGVFDSLISKKQQLSLATQLAKMILKIDDVIKHGDN